MPPEIPTLPDGMIILELGCGNGKTLSAMIRRCWDIVAVDVSPKAVQMCQMMVEMEEDRCLSRVEVMVADACALPFEDETFDAVFAFHVVGHVPQHERDDMADEIWRVLKPGGKVFFKGFGRGDMRYGKGKEVEDDTFLRNGILVHYFNKEEVLEVFVDFEVEDLRIDQWETLIRGKRLPRQVVEGTFVKVSQ